MLLSPIGSPRKALANLALALALPPHHLSLHHHHRRHHNGNTNVLDAGAQLRLPVELIYYIVELALVPGMTNGSVRRCALALCLVSSWVREATLPIMYRTIVLHGNMHSPYSTPTQLHQQPVTGSCSGSGLGLSLSLGLRLSLSHSGLASPALSPLPSPHPLPHPQALTSPLKYIEHLWLDVPLEQCPFDFNDCGNLVQLAIRVDAFDAILRSDRWFASPTISATATTTDDDSIFGYSPCRSLTVLGQSHTTKWLPFINSITGLSFLRGLTHLRILNMCLSTYIPLDCTPRLTHLCVPYFDLRPNDVPDFANLDPLLEFKQLQMIVITLNPKYWRFEEKTLKEWACHAMSKDTRLYVVASTRQDATKDWDDPRRDWEAEASGGLSIWKKAVQVRKKFLQRLSRTFEPSSFAAL